MKNMIWVTTISILFFVFVVPGIFAVLLKMIPDNIQPPLQKTADIYREFTVSQEFTSVSNNLTCLGMSIKNPNLANKKDVYFSLFDISGILVRQVKLSGMNIEDGGFIKFIFDPIKDSANKKYIFTLSSPGAGPGDLLAIYYSDQKLFWMGQMKTGKFDSNGAISFVTFYKPTSRLDTLNKVYSNWLSRLLFGH